MRADLSVHLLGGLLFLMSNRIAYIGVSFTLYFILIFLERSEWLKRYEVSLASEVYAPLRTVNPFLLACDG